MLTKFSRFLALGLVLFAPVVSFAQVDAVRNLNDLFRSVLNSVNDYVIPLLFAAALIVFFWGLIVFITKTDEDSRKNARQHMLWGIVAIAVMAGVWGLVGIVLGTFGVDAGGGAPDLPEV